MALKETHARPPRRPVLRRRSRAIVEGTRGRHEQERRAASAWASATRRRIGGRSIRVGRIWLRPIGYVRSPIRSVEEAPRFYTEGAPNAFLEVYPRFRPALTGLRVGGEVIVLTWLHLARRDVLKTHPRGDRSRPLEGVFHTRSPGRPNPIGLHRCRILAVRRDGLRLGPIEVVDGTPVLDLKRVVAEADDS